MQTKAILLFYNALTFVCYIPLLVALIVFYRFTGLAYIDVKKLVREKIQEGLDGQLWIMTKRGKTGTDVKVPLLEVPLGILEKYKDTDESSELSKPLLPVLSNQKMNSYLKEIGDLCGIEKNLTFHCAKHHTISI